MKLIQLLDEESASNIYWQIINYGKPKFWAVVPTNPLRVELCSRGTLPDEVVISTANIGDWVVQDEGNFYIENQKGDLVESIRKIIPEPTKRPLRADLPGGYCGECGGHSHSAIHCPNVIPTTQCDCHPLPEPTFTQSQVNKAITALITKLRDEVADEMASVHHSCERVHHPDIDCEVCRYKRAGMNQVLALLEKAGE